MSDLSEENSLLSIKKLDKEILTLRKQLKNLIDKKRTIQKICKHEYHFYEAFYKDFDIEPLKRCLICGYFE